MASKMNIQMQQIEFGVSKLEILNMISSSDTKMTAKA